MLILCILPSDKESLADQHDMEKEAKPRYINAQSDLINILILLNEVLNFIS